MKIIVKVLIIFFIKFDGKKRGYFLMCSGVVLNFKFIFLNGRVIVKYFIRELL